MADQPIEAQDILDNVRLALDDAECMGGPEGDAYLELMAAVGAEVTRRANAYRAAGYPEWVREQRERAQRTTFDPGPAPKGPTRFGHEETVEDIRARIVWERWAANKMRYLGHEVHAQGHDLTRVAYQNRLNEVHPSNSRLTPGRRP